MKKILFMVFWTVIALSVSEVRAFPLAKYDIYTVTARIVDLKIIEEESASSVGKASYTLEIIGVTPKTKQANRAQKSSIQSGDSVEAESIFTNRYGSDQYLTTSIEPSQYNPSEFMPGDYIKVGLLYAGSESILFANAPEHHKNINSSFYVVMLFGGLIMMVIFGLVVKYRK